MMAMRCSFCLNATSAMHDKRRRCGAAFQVVFKPFELIGTEISHTAALEI